MNGIWRISFSLILLWIGSMVVYSYFYTINIFWRDIFFNFIYGIPLSAIVSIASAKLYSDFTNTRKLREAKEFYKKFEGCYVENEYVSLKNPKPVWLVIKISQVDLDLKVEFIKRINRPEALRAELNIPGTAEKKRNFEIFYEQESTDGNDGGYWGKYDIMLLDTGEVVGHKYYTSNKANADGRVNYIISRIKWQKLIHE